MINLFPCILLRQSISNRQKTTIKTTGMQIIATNGPVNLIERSTIIAIDTVDLSWVIP